MDGTDFEQWRIAADAEDVRQEIPAPTSDFPAVVQGCNALLDAAELLQDLSVPGALARARAKISWALGRIPQDGPDESCHHYRWRSSLNSDDQFDVCSKPSCGRCAPLMEARATHEEPDGGRCEGCQKPWVPEDDYTPYLGGFVVHTKDCPVLLASK
ncbi:hypothetical protein FHS39_002396 [Streptomyces olivoverticillatus]|uniref:Uncharacterized protein n=1 Tax=Streptomyces olivoverticillatus TaxID=66427 RepID=A0A7W7LN83_9ACTN|nr:hypothetical protein [Streptomyces olivoverticillatus]MBB4893365.1 hypothetical protein [Streptomyces olivoverticillatus]